MDLAQRKAKLVEYLTNCDEEERSRVLKTIRQCNSEGVRGFASIFDEFSSSEWRKEILTYALLSKNPEWDESQRIEVVSRINELNVFMKEQIQHYSTEDVLEFIFASQKECELNIECITRVLMLLRSEKSLERVFEDSYLSPAVLPQLELLNFKQKCDKYRIVYSGPEQIEELKSLLTYPDKIIDSFLSRVKRNTDITELINFLRNVKSRQDSLSQLTDGKSVDLDKSISLLGIERCIQAAFPNWNYELATNIPKHLTVAFDKKYFSADTSSDERQYTKYTQVSNPHQELLNETLGSEDHLFLQKLLYDLNMSLLKLVSKLDSLDKIERQLEVFVKSLDSVDKIIQLINAVEILIEWGVDILETGAFDIISNSTEVTVRESIHNFVINQYFSETYEKSIDDLIDELFTSNADESIKLLENRNYLKVEYQRVMSAYEGNSALKSNIGSIRNWNKSYIAGWSQCFMLSRITKHFYDVTASSELKSWIVSVLASRFPSDTPNSHDEAKAQQFSDYVTRIASKYERIAVIMQTVELTMGIKLRDVQILAIILLLDSEMNKGRLAQINTGEGKTTIIAALAAYHALDGRKVDVITSSKLLVYPQLKELKDFYETLQLGVSHNFESSDAYLLDIVYGTSNEFQGDILRDEFRKLDIRHSRKCDVAIVDEVDNMLVDGNDHVVLLSCNMPGMDHLETLLAIISIQVKAAASTLRANGNGEICFVQSENAFDKNGEIKETIHENYVPINVSPYKFIMESTDLHLRKLIRACDESTNNELKINSDYPEIKVPKHLRRLIDKIQLKKWIERAIAAKVSYANREDYILDKDEIKIVDVENTGVVQSNTQWSDGLHQFIQIKHGACITPESFTTNFISNVSYFRRYRPDIYGLTGTLGCQGTKQLLKNTYSVDSVIIPPFKLKQHHQLLPIIIDDEETWLREIVKNSLRKVTNGRAVLIITEYIRQIEAIEKIFIDEFNYDKKRINLYKTDDDSVVLEKPLHPGDILITTNIAGRGADIKVIEAIDKNGGLHVCLTFLPMNSRVEEQNVGRTSRTGNRGTSQFILNNSEKDLRKLREQRYAKEEAALRDAAEEIDRVITKDSVFREFCELTDIIKDRNEFVRDIKRGAVEERFASWLKMNDEEFAGKPESEALKLFESFREKILEDDRRGRLVRNPYMYVKIGNKYLEEKQYVSAINEYTLACDLDPDFAEHAHYNRGCAYIAQYGGDLIGNGEYIDKAVEDFRKARELIEEKEHNLHLMEYASENQVYSRQISNKLNLYNIQKSAIEIAIGPDKDAIDRNIKNLEKRKGKSERDSDDWKNISEMIESLEERKENIGVIQEARNNERELRIKIFEWKKCLPIGDESHDKEIEEVERNGAIGSFHISELPPIDWTSVIGLLLLGFGQLIAGAALAIFSLGAGASFGIALIAEGISDIITAVKDGIINRDFSWERWAFEKAISLTVSVVCAGWIAMRDVALTIRGGVRMVGSLGRRVVPPLVKEGWKLVFRKVGLDLTKAASKEFIGGLTNYAISEMLMPWLQQRITDVVEEPIATALAGNRNVKMVLELDKRNNNTNYEDRIRTIGLELLNPANPSKDLAYITNFAKKMSDRIVDNRNPQLAKYRKLHDLKANLSKVFMDLPVMAYKFIKDLNEAIDSMAKSEKIEELYKNKAKSTMHSEAPIESHHDLKEDRSGFDVKRFEDKEEQVKPQHTNNGPLRIAKNYSDTISSLMINVIQRDFAAPVVQMTTDSVVDRATASKTESLDGYIETFKNRRRVPHMVNEEFESNEEVEE